MIVFASVRCGQKANQSDNNAIVQEETELKEMERARRSSHSRTRVVPVNKGIKSAALNSAQMKAAVRHRVAEHPGVLTSEKGGMLLKCACCKTYVKLKKSHTNDHLKTSKHKSSAIDCTNEGKIKFRHPNLEFTLTTRLVV
jgi:hypothetical protein